MKPKYKAGRVEYSIDTRKVYGRTAYFPMILRGCAVKGPFCLAPGVTGHVTGVSTRAEAIRIIRQDAAGKNLKTV